MRGRWPRLQGTVSTELVSVVEAALVGLVVAFASLGESDGGGVPEWMPFVPAVLLALVVAAHRGPLLWRTVVGGWPDRSASAALRSLWRAVEVAAAVGFLGLLAVMALGLVGSLFAAGGQAYDVGVELFATSLRAAIVAAVAFLTLLVAVTARLVATALVRLWRSAVALTP